MAECDTDDEPGPDGVSKAAIVSFEATPALVVGKRRITLSWKAEGARSISVQRRAPGGAPPLPWEGIDGAVQFLRGNIEVQIDRDSEFRLLAHPEGPDDHEDLVARQTLLVDHVPAPLFYGLLVSVAIAICSVWFSSEVLFHGTDLVENDPLLQAGNGISRFVALGSTVLGAPLVAAMLQMRTGTGSGRGQLALILLRRPWLTIAATLACLAVPVLSAIVAWTSTRIFLNSDLDRPVYAWSCKAEGSELVKGDRLRLVIPKGFSSARVRKSQLFLSCLEPAGVLIAGEGDDTSTQNRDFATDRTLTLNCRTTMEIDRGREEPDGDRYSLRWDDNSAVPLDEAAGKLLATKQVRDCESYPRGATLDRRSSAIADADALLVWTVRLDRNGNHHAKIDFSDFEVELPADHEPVHATLGLGDQWRSTRVCKAPSCLITTPSKVLGGSPRHLCLAPLAPTGDANTSASCAENQPWSLFYLVAARRSSTTDDEGASGTSASLPPGAKQREQLRAIFTQQAVEQAALPDDSTPQIVQEILGEAPGEDANGSPAHGVGDENRTSGSPAPTAAREAYAQLSTLYVCAGDEAPAGALRVEMEGVRFQGAGVQGRAGIAWPTDRLEAGAEVEVGSEKQVTKTVPILSVPRHGKDLWVVQPPVERRDFGQVSVTLNGRPKTSLAGMHFLPWYPDSGAPCRNRAGTEIVIRGPFLTFRGLPTWATQRDTQWAMVDGRSNSSAACSLKPATRHLECTTTGGAP